jgi:hypothetical protein
MGGKQTQVFHKHKESERKRTKNKRTGKALTQRKESQTKDGKDVSIIDNYKSKH